ncbi:purine-cytosine permease family protein [Phaeacidiphilus oryzae]|uniref:purine-cytosine permease family protein n=1 Tax=Phaeacidiphilus oryzae TaxID=348818 RepID=UPI00056CE43E|nr:membrane protein [Phaeacidiphilus oryzae]
MTIPRTPTQPGTPPEAEGRRRSYARAAADESLEDYSLRYAPHSFRRWTPLAVASTALGGIAYLADYAIGASIALSYGFTNAVASVLAAAVVIFLTGIPIARACAANGIDMDLLTRGCGFGYLGSTLTSVIYASFTFIFFATEGSIMAQALQRALHVPLPVGYLITTLIVIPIVFKGMNWLARMQAWTQPVWLLGLVLPFVALAVADPGAYSRFAHFGGTGGGAGGFSWYGFGMGAGVALSLIAQIGEQADYLRFMPRKTAVNRRRWNLAVLAAGPGWVVIGAIKQLGGGLLAVAALGAVGEARALEPIDQILHALRPWFGGVALPLAALFVIVSQVKINSTNAYSGSLSWSNFFSRLTHRHPGRVWYIFLNCGVSLLLMELNMFSALSTLLGFYSNVAIAWIGAVAADLMISKPLGLSPKYIEFKRAYLRSVNPAGFGAMIVASAVSLAGFFGAFGDYGKAFSPFVALALAMLLNPLIAFATRGRYYLARPNPLAADDSSETRQCVVCAGGYESPDVAGDCPHHGGDICSLCCSLESACGEACKRGEAAEPVLMGMPAMRG